MLATISVSKSKVIDKEVELVKMGDRQYKLALTLTQAYPEAGPIKLFNIKFALSFLSNTTSLLNSNFCHCKETIQLTKRVSKFSQKHLCKTNSWAHCNKTI